MPSLGPTEIIIIAVVVLILFGSKKLPDASRALGRSMRIFKSETKGLHDDDGDDKSGSRRDTSSQQHTDSAEPQRLPASDDPPAVDGKVVNRDRAQEPR